MLATSLGFGFDARLGEAVPPRKPSVVFVVLSTGMPSTTMSGCPVPRIVFWPRIRMKDDAPGSPDWPTTSTLGALPASA